jgi:hypothetical protein
VWCSKLAPNCIVPLQIKNDSSFWSFLELKARYYAATSFLCRDLGSAVFGGLKAPAAAAGPGACARPLQPGLVLIFY